MTKQALLKKLDGMLDDAARERAWCEITISCKDGQPDLLRKMTTEKLNNTMGDTRGQNSYR